MLLSAAMFQRIEMHVTRMRPSKQATGLLTLPSPLQQHSMFRALATNLQSCWKKLVLADVLFKVIAFVLLTPLVSLLFRLFLSLSGRTVLADADIAHFLIHPLGWIAVVVVGGAAIGILALEQAALMAISLASAHGRTLSVLGSLQFVAGKGPASSGSPR